MSIEEFWRREYTVEWDLSVPVFLFQIGEEIKGCLDFLKFVYNKFGFSFKLFLSTRPEKYMGKLELWDSAEKVRLLITVIALFDWESWKQNQSNHNSQSEERKIPWRANEKTQNENNQTASSVWKRGNQVVIRLSLHLIGGKNWDFWTNHITK